MSSDTAADQERMLFLERSNAKLQDDLSAANSKVFNLELLIEIKTESFEKQIQERDALIQELQKAFDDTDRPKALISGKEVQGADSREELASTKKKLTSTEKELEELTAEYKELEELNNVAFHDFERAIREIWDDRQRLRAYTRLQKFALRFQEKFASQLPNLGPLVDDDVEPISFGAQSLTLQSPSMSASPASTTGRRSHPETSGPATHLEGVGIEAVRTISLITQYIT